MCDLATVAFPFLDAVEETFYVHETCRVRTPAELRCGFLYLAAHMLSVALVHMEMPELKAQLEQLTTDLDAMLKWLAGKKNLGTTPEGKPVEETDTLWASRGRSKASALRVYVRSLRPRLLAAHALKTGGYGLEDPEYKELDRSLIDVENLCLKIQEEPLPTAGSWRRDAVTILHNASDTVRNVHGFLQKMSGKNLTQHAHDVYDQHLAPALFAGLEKDEFEGRLLERAAEVVRTSGIWHASFGKPFLTNGR